MRCEYDADSNRLNLGKISHFLSLGDSLYLSREKTANLWFTNTKFQQLE